MKNVYFLHTDIGSSLTGIEKSAMIRGNLFIKYLGITPTFITVLKNKKVRQNWERYVENGVVDSEIPMINLYDYLQKTEEGRQLPAYHLKKEKTYGYQEVNTKDDSYHLRVFDTNNQQIKYLVFTDQQLLSHINYFHEGRKIARDHFNAYGQLSHTEYLTENNLAYVTEYFDVYGKRVLTKHVDGPILVAGNDSAYEAVLEDEQALMLYFLKKIIEAESIVMIDRNKKFSSLFIKNKQINAKLVSIIHSTYFSDIESRAKINSNYQKVLNSPYSFENIVVLTNRQKKEMEQQFGITNLVTIPHPRPVPYISEDVNISSNKLISVGRLASEKNLNHMLEALVLVKKEIPDVTLELYGKGKEEKKLRQLAIKLGLQKNVQFNGYQDNLTTLYTTAELFLFTGQAEGFTMSVLESLSYGCPVVSYNVRYGVDEMIQNDHNGFHVTFDDKKQFANQIIFYLNKTTAEKNTYRKAAQQSTITYAEDKVADRWRQLLQGLS
ncbi:MULTISPECIES: glycosyltransferase [Gracilibacillus]|uniref:glycosyltransferase n=1 Tax=Gracilibacillus TaxID=74385 RepID=UPI0008269C97|nr:MULTISPECIES: glycosyltransferase [Gracilibacillus]